MDPSQISYIKIFVFLTLSSVVASRYLPGSAVQQTTQINLKKLANANNYFALNLHRQLVEDAKEENVLFSPLSLSMAFGMLLLGARDATAAELRKVLGYQKAKLPDELIHLTFQRFLSEELTKNSSKGYTLNIANAILVDRRLPLLSSYRDAAGARYRAPVQNLDFANSASKVKNSINNWVNSKTNGKIERLLDELSDEVIMIILNAVYFKGLWKIPFDGLLTSNNEFYNNGQEAKKVPTMHMTATKLPFTYTEDYQALELPYEGNVSMMIFLPTQRDGLPALEASMTLEQFNNIRKSMRAEEVTVFLPKFRIEYSKSLNEELKALGMQKMYHSSTADLSGISRAVGLKVSDVFHKAYVSVDEMGTEAAAATSFSIIPYSGIRSDHWFIADHPFLFTIFDKKSGMILFWGRVNSL